MKEKCQNCGEVKLLTKDHKIPQWFLSYLMEVKVDFNDITEYEGNNIVKICGHCNVKKGYSLPTTQKVEILIDRLFKKRNEGLYIPAKVMRMIRAKIQ